jgi:hypothetical protein
MCLGCVVRVESIGQDVRYVWPVHVSSVDPGEEALHGTSP